MNYTKKFIIITEECVELCAPSKDYYARGNDWRSEHLYFLKADISYNSEEEAIKEAFKKGIESFYIIPHYEFTKS